MPPADGSMKSAAKGLVRWFRASARPMPWRTLPLGTARDPYRVLVSELMLQQTQVARVAPAFERFMARFPTLADLARAEEREVLALWSGLGYYRRARLLHAAAKRVAETHGGEMPRTPEGLRTLPGLGAYTAAAVASLAFHEPVAMVDGNVTRVMLRVHAREGVASDPKEAKWARERATDLVQIAGPRPAPTLAAEALMELGATVCVPRNPACLVCPLADVCVARRLGLQDRIPTPKKTRATPVVHATCVLLEDRQGRAAVEIRPPTGMWASMAQAPTIERPGETDTLTADMARDAFGLPHTLRLEAADRFEHQTTHRLFTFTVFRTRVTDAQKRAIQRTRPGVRWLTREEIAEMPLSKVQSRVLLGARNTKT